MQYSLMQYSFDSMMPIILGFNALEIRHVLQLLEKLEKLTSHQSVEDITCYFYCIEKNLSLRRIA